MGTKMKIALGAAVGLVVIGAVSANGGDGDGGSGSGKDTATSSVTAGKDSGSGSGSGSDGKDAKSDTADKGAEKASQAEQFKSFVDKNGSPNEKDAVAHVTKVQGAEEQNDILDSADVYTDFTGGLMGEGTGPAKLIASAFADWKQSENGLVTVYDADGEILGNGNF
ncbi:hypothetical protein [Streptomyces minutiscleroticus]|uniref:Lipoprotein n=1 Tax=Streptomyces minutiscleroticus TaxID=68238 RepID=A0A918KPI5_9ACTN|nr:hypothetical protein [Streptomyces minutiscleroticus]GGX68495.1 hypothetical protein GCM10010358_23760 [Streptomyces minutiscleroticus]